MDQILIVKLVILWGIKTIYPPFYRRNSTLRPVVCRHTKTNPSGLVDHQKIYLWAGGLLKHIHIYRPSLCAHHSWCTWDRAAYLCQVLTAKRPLYPHCQRGETEVPHSSFNRFIFMESLTDFFLVLMLWWKFNKKLINGTQVQYFFFLTSSPWFSSSESKLHWNIVCFCDMQYAFYQRKWYMTLYWTLFSQFLQFHQKKST